MASTRTNPLSVAWRWFGPGGNWKMVLGAMTALAVAAYIVSLKLNLSACRTDFANFRTEVAERERQALQTASTGRTEANGVRASARQKITAEQSAKRKELTDALDANPDWANQPVPRAVADSLR